MDKIEGWQVVYNSRMWLPELRHTEQCSNHRAGYVVRDGNAWKCEVCGDPVPQSLINLVELAGIHFYYPDIEIETGLNTHNYNPTIPDWITRVG